MLTKRTQNFLCNLLINLSKAESSIQITRKILLNSVNYSPNHIFAYLSNSNKITDIELHNYLVSKNISVNITEVKLIILFYDKNLDNELSYEEFLNLINDKKIFDDNFLIPYNNAINDNIEYLLEKILLKEIELSRKILFYLKMLHSRNDFEIHKVFHYITNQNYINKSHLEHFLRENQFNFLDSDLINITKRLDIRKDGIIDIKELYSLFEFPKSVKNNYNINLCTICKKLEDNSSIKNKEHNFNLEKNKNIFHRKQQKNIFKNNRYKDNFEIKSMYNYSNNNFYNIKTSLNNKENISSSSKIERRLFNSQPKIEKYNINNINKNNNAFSSRLNNNFQKSEIINNIKRIINLLRNTKYNKFNSKYDIYPQNNLNPNIKSYKITEIDFYINSNQNFFEKFNNYLKLITESEAEIEKEKINFVKNKEIPFTLIYSFFDEDGKGYITENELINAFFKLKIIDDENCELFMNRYDTLKNKKITKEEFFDIIVPFNKTYRKNFEEIIINKYIEENYNINEDMNILSNIKNLINFIINKEKQINNYKINFIDKNYSLDIIEEIFNLIDKDKKSFFSYEDLNLYMKNYNITSDNYSIALLFIRMDKKRKGKIELGDIMREL